MKSHYSLVLILLFYACNGENKRSAQKIKTEKVSEAEYIELDEGPCLYQTTTNQLDTISLYRNAVKIAIYGYNNPFEPVEYMGLEEREKKIKEALERFDQKIFITKPQKDSLFKILTGFKKETAIAEASCYDPRHRISFLDKDDKIIGEIHICFSCNQTVSTIPLFNFICDDQLNYYRDFFFWCGITKGFSSH